MEPVSFLLRRELYLFKIGAAPGNEYFRAGADSIAGNSRSLPG